MNVFPIHVPPLRDRPEDILLLAKYFIDRYAAKLAKRIRQVEKRTAELLEAYDWPGNIRELQNVIERAMILCDSDTYYLWKSLGCDLSRRVMPACDLPYRITNKRSLKLHWPKLMARSRARTARPRSSGSREQPWNPKLRASTLTRIVIGREMATSHRICDLFMKCRFRWSQRHNSGLWLMAGHGNEH